MRIKLCLSLHPLIRSSQDAYSGIIHSPSPGYCSVNESLLLGWVLFTVPSHGTMRGASSATNSPRGEEGAFQSPAATTGVTIHHQPSTSSPLLITALSFSSQPFLLAPFTFWGSVSHLFLPPCQISPAAFLEPNIARDEEEWLLGVPAALPGMGREGQEGAAVM